MKPIPIPTKEQEAIIESGDGAYLVIAPPGSGKTTVLTERVLRLAAQPGSYRVLALTFTNKAANNIAARFDLAGRADLDRVTAQTIHAFCHDLLRHYGNRIELEDFTIYDKDADRLIVLREGLQQEKLPCPDDDRTLRDLLEAIGRLKRDLITPAEAPKSIEKAGMALDAAYEAYDSMLRKNGALDFDDLLVYSFRLLTGDEQVRDLYRTLYRYVLIDEAQDTSLAQYEILHAVFCDPSHRNLMMVADADQSIFQFTGAKVEYLLRFEADFRAARCGLTRNFRCAGTIVAAANSLIAYNPGRLTSGEEMSSAVLAPGVVTATSYATQEDEATAAVEHALALVSNGLPESAVYEDEDARVTAEQVCILGRSRYLLNAVLAELQRRDVDFQFSASSRDLGVFESKEFTMLDTAIRWCVNPSDSLSKRALARMLGISSQSWPRSSTLIDVADTLPIDVGTLLAPLREGKNRLAVDRLMTTVADFVDQCSDSDAHIILASDMELLRGRWERIRNNAGEDALARLQSEVALLGTAKLSGPGLRVLTIHAAKGLEFRAVILVGMNEGSFPDFRSTTGSLLTEERRNAYVAFTRAERVLELMRFRSRPTRYGPKTQVQSQFIQEAGLSMQRQ